jgi:hypothetical protein
MPMTKMTVAMRSGHCGPIHTATAPIGATRMPATAPYTEARAPASDSPRPAGSSRGTAALRATP